MHHNEQPLDMIGWQDNTEMALNAINWAYSSRISGDFLIVETDKWQ